MAQSIFRKQSLDKVNSPEELNDYIRTATPSAWLVTAAAVVLLVSVLVWGIFGSLDTTVALPGVVSGSTLTCYTTDPGDIQVGDAVSVGDLSGEVVEISSSPLSRDSITAAFTGSDYTLYQLDLAEWSYVITIQLSGTPAEEFVSARIVTERVNPISFVIG